MIIFCRAYWQFQNQGAKKEDKKEERNPSSVFCSTSKLVKLDHKRKELMKSNYMQQEGNCVVIGKRLIVEDVNSMIGIINKVMYNIASYFDLSSISKDIFIRSLKQ